MKRKNKMKIRRLDEQQKVCHCGLWLTTRHGTTECFIHGQGWSRRYTEGRHWPEEETSNAVAAA
jgi:hypothetical protein